MSNNEMRVLVSNRIPGNVLYQLDETFFCFCLLVANPEAYGVTTS